MESRKYFVIIDNEQKGPLSFSDLELLNLDNHTPIWFEGIDEWTVLEKVDELNRLKKLVPPAYNNSDYISSLPPKFSSIKDEDEVSFIVKNKMPLIILVVVVVLFVVYSIFNFSKDYKQHDEDSVSNTNLEKGIDSTTYNKKIRQKELFSDELRQELLNTEKNNPLKYLSAESSMSENNVQIQNATMFRHSKWEVDGYILTGSIENKATLASYKDIKLRVIFYSKTKSKIKSEDFVIYDFVNPNNKINFSQKIYPPQEMADYQISVVNASN